MDEISPKVAAREELMQELRKALGRTAKMLEDRDESEEYKLLAFRFIFWEEAKRAYEAYDKRLKKIDAPAAEEKKELERRGFRHF